METIGPNISIKTLPYWKNERQVEPIPEALKRGSRPIQLSSLSSDEFRAYLDRAASFVPEPVPELVGQDDDYNYYRGGSYFASGEEHFCVFTGEKRTRVPR